MTQCIAGIITGVKSLQVGNFAEIAAHVRITEPVRSSFSFRLMVLANFIQIWLSCSITIDVLITLGMTILVHLPRLSAAISC